MNAWILISAMQMQLAKIQMDRMHVCATTVSQEMVSIAQVFNYTLMNDLFHDLEVLFFPKFLLQISLESLRTVSSKVSLEVCIIPSDLIQQSYIW